MKSHFLLATLVFAAASASAQSANVCPVLPAVELVWTHKAGPDYDLCYAKPPGSKETIFGVFLGKTPVLDVAKATVIGAGEVGGYGVTWYKQQMEPGVSKFARQTLVAFDNKRGVVAHIWVSADTEEQLAQRLGVLKRIKFNTGPADK